MPGRTPRTNSLTVASLTMFETFTIFCPLTSVTSNPISMTAVADIGPSLRTVVDSFRSQLRGCRFHRVVADWIELRYAITHRCALHQVFARQRFVAKRKDLAADHPTRHCQGAQRPI